MIVKKAARAKGSSCATAALLTGLASLLALLLCASSARSMGPNSAALLSVPPSKAWLMDWLWATRDDDFDEYPAVGRITSLPGLLTTLPEMYSGYIAVGPNESRRLFYVYVQSEGDPSSDPLILWTNGGPGCSGLQGLLMEMGPLRVSSDGSLVRNRHAWTAFANMIFLEQPVGTGFSYIDEAEVGRA